jgi:hypothetical protein
MLPEVQAVRLGQKEGIMSDEFDYITGLRIRIAGKRRRRYALKATAIAALFVIGWIIGNAIR